MLSRRPVAALYERRQFHNYEIAGGHRPPLQSLSEFEIYADGGQDFNGLSIEQRGPVTPLPHRFHSGSCEVRINAAQHAKRLRASIHTDDPFEDYRTFNAAILCARRIYRSDLINQIRCLDVAANSNSPGSIRREECCRPGLSSSGDSDSLDDIAQQQGDVLFEVFVGMQHDPVPIRYEARHCRFKLVFTGLQVWKCEPARFVSRRLLTLLRLYIGCGNDHAGYDRAPGVVDGT
jgi:hypothetical protein